MLQHTSFRLLAKKLSKEELAESRAQVSTQPDGAQAGSHRLVTHPSSCLAPSAAAALSQLWSCRFGLFDVRRREL